MKTIYTIYAREFLVHEKGRYLHDRTFGWLPTEKDAKKMIKKNGEFIHEYLYDYVVIEKFSSGFLCMAVKEWWYKWDGKKYKSIPKPKELMNVVSFGMG